MMKLFYLSGSSRRINIGLRVYRNEFAHSLQCSTPCFKKLFPRVTRPKQGCYQKRADDSDQDLLRSVEADLPCLCRIGDTIARDGKRGETEQKISIWDLACTDLAELVAGKGHDQEKH